MVLRGLVRGGRDHSHAVVVGVLDGLPCELGVVQRAERLLDHERSVVHSIEDRLPEVVAVGHERVPDAHRDRHAVRTGAGVVSVVCLRRGPLRLSRSVPVLDVVVGVVVVVEEVPAGDVVHEAVGVTVAAVRERDDQVLRCHHPGRPDPPGIAEIHAGVARVVTHVEDSVAVAVVRGAAVRQRQLAAIQPGLAPQVQHRPGVVPLDAGVEHGERHVVPAGGRLPSRVDGGVGVDDVASAHAEELARVGRIGAAGLGGGGVLPVVVVAAQVVRRDARPDLVLRSGAVREVGSGGSHGQAQRDQAHGNGQTRASEPSLRRSPQPLPLCALVSEPIRTARPEPGDVSAPTPNERTFSYPWRGARKPRPGGGGSSGRGSARPPRRERSARPAGPGWPSRAASCLA